MERCGRGPFEVLPGDLPGVIEKNQVKVSQYPT